MHRSSGFQLNNSEYSDECGSDRCWFDTTGPNAVTTEGDCDDKAVTASGSTDGFSTQWRTDMGGSAAGVCTFTSGNIQVGPDNDDDKFDPERKGDEATNKLKTLCEAQTGGNFYVGRRFQEGIMAPRQNATPNIATSVASTNKWTAPLAPVLAAFARHGARVAVDAAHPTPKR